MCDNQSNNPWTVVAHSHSLPLLSSHSNILRLSFSKVRESRRLKLVELGRLAGLSHSSISHWLNGSRDLSTDSLASLLAAAEELSPGAITEFSLLLSSGGLQDFNQFADLLHLMAGEFRRLKDAQPQQLERVGS
jgi:transcriptional regulator with XRE-family HTH domain